MKLNAKTFKNVEIGTVLVKSPEYEDPKEYIVTKITSKFICCKYRIKQIHLCKQILNGTYEGKSEFTKRIPMKFFDGKDGNCWITEWNIKDEEWEKEWNKYFDGCGTENWYYTHGGN